MSGDSAKARMGRILRLHEEIDAIKADIKDIYAEEKADGGDKTAMGAAISIIRKREKDATAFDEQQGIVDVYLSAYLGTGTVVATHTHAPEPVSVVRGESPALHPPVESGSAEISTPIPFVQKPLRPYCQNPGNGCGGMGKKHCWKCQKEHDEAQGAA